MRYQEAELEELKRSNPTEDIFREHGYELIKRGNHLATLCRYHPDKDPSLIITPENGLWNCLGCSSHNGGSKTGGDVFEFLMKERKTNFIGAVEYLKQRNGNGSFLAAKPAAKIKKAITINIQKLLNRVIEFYQKVFTEDKRGYDYLTKERDITDQKILEIFRIGFCNGTLFKAIPQEGEVVEGLKEIGILSKTGHELFKDCVVFPILDKNGNVIHIYGRKIIEEPVRHLYLPGNHRGVFNRHILKSYDEVILTESIIDSLSLYQAGFKNTVPCYGVNGLTEDHVTAFKENNTKNIIILFDGDDTGRKSSEDLKQKLETYFFRCRIASLPDNEDPNSYLKKYPQEEIEKIIYGTAKKEKPINTIPKNINEIEDGFILEFCQRRYVIRGIEGNHNRLKANIRAENHRKFHIDTVDLYSSRARKMFIQDAINLFKEEHEIIEQDMEKIITSAEAYVEGQAARVKGQEQREMTEDEKKEALRFGRNTNLIDEIVKDIERCGYIGEEMNKLICYLAMTSRKMEEPLSILIISGSGAGKTSLQDTILSMCPEEDLIKLTSLTGKALFYKKECSLSHKVLAIEEEKGAEDAGYAIRNLITSKKLSVEATIKDVYTGKMTTMENTVKGPTCVFKTTTNPEIDPETKTRFITISIDESIEQTRRILDYQRETYTMEGFLQKQEKEEIIQKHKNFQRLLRPLAVFNPYSKLLTYLDDRLLVRRENPKYMNIINTVAFIHQLQRPIKEVERGSDKIEYVEVTLEDIQIANEIAHNILGKSLSELSVPSRNLLNLIFEMVLGIEKTNGKTREEIQFSRRQIREYTKWSDYQVKVHIKQLEDLEYLIPVMGSRGKQYSYKLAYNGEGQDGSRFVLGLINTEKLREMLRNGETRRVLGGR